MELLSSKSTSKLQWNGRKTIHSIPFLSLSLPFCKNQKELVSKADYPKAQLIDYLPHITLNPLSRPLASTNQSNLKEDYPVVQL